MVQTSRVRQQLYLYRFKTFHDQEDPLPVKDSGELTSSTETNHPPAMTPVQLARFVPLLQNGRERENYLLLKNGCRFSFPAMKSQQLGRLLHFLPGRSKKLNTWISELGEEANNLLAGRGTWVFILEDDFSSVAKSGVWVRIPLPSAESGAIVSFRLFHPPAKPAASLLGKQLHGELLTDVQV